MSGAHQSCSTPPLLSWPGKRKYNERLLSWGKGRERSVIACCHGQNRPNVGKLIEFITSQIRVQKWEVKQILTFLPGTPPSLLGLTVLPVLSLLFLSVAQEDREGGYNPFLTCFLCHCFLHRGKILPLLQQEVPPMADSLPQTSPTWILPMSCSSSLTALVWVIFHCVQSSRSSPFQHGSPMESQVLSANLL